MKLYLSSYLFGDNPETLSAQFSTNKKVAVILNALDFSDDLPRVKRSEDEQIAKLKELGLEPEVLDLRNYFGKKDLLKAKLDEFGGVWVHGGNTFLLAAAYKLSGMDEILQEYIGSNPAFVYAGFSAAGCVLQKSLKGIEFVDDSEIVKPTYGVETVWEGVGLLDFVFVPHFESEHEESEDTNVEIEFYKENDIEYKTLHDGEVMIMEIK